MLGEDVLHLTALIQFQLTTAETFLHDGNFPVWGEITKRNNLYEAILCPFA